MKLKFELEMGPEEVMLIVQLVCRLFLRCIGQWFKTSASAPSSAEHWPISLPIVDCQFFDPGDHAGVFLGVEGTQKYRERLVNVMCGLVPIPPDMDVRSQEFDDWCEQQRTVAG